MIRRSIKRLGAYDFERSGDNLEPLEAVPGAYKPPPQAQGKGSLRKTIESLFSPSRDSLFAQSWLEKKAAKVKEIVSRRVASVRGRASHPKKKSLRAEGYQRYLSEFALEAMKIRAGRGGSSLERRFVLSCGLSDPAALHEGSHHVSFFVELAQSGHKVVVVLPWADGASMRVERLKSFLREKSIAVETGKERLVENDLFLSFDPLTALYAATSQRTQRKAHAFFALSNYLFPSLEEREGILLQAAASLGVPFFAEGLRVQEYLQNTFSLRPRLLPLGVETHYLAEKNTKRLRSTVVVYASAAAPSFELRLAAQAIERLRGKLGKSVRFVVCTSGRRGGSVSPLGDLHFSSPGLEEKKQIFQAGSVGLFVGTQTDEIVALEMMAAGLPVIAFQGHRFEAEFLQRGAFFTVKQNEERLRSVLLRLLFDSAMTVRLKNQLRVFQQYAPTQEKRALAFREMCTKLEADFRFENEFASPFELPLVSNE